jgi:cadmium resistance protein CadD (predicted permease)
MNAPKLGRVGVVEERMHRDTGRLPGGDQRFRVSQRAIDRSGVWYQRVGRAHLPFEDRQGAAVLENLADYGGPLSAARVKQRDQRSSLTGRIRHRAHVIPAQAGPKLAAMGEVVAAAGVFAGTNVDDLIVLTVLFLASQTAGSPKRWQIWLGQYAGIAVLVAVSALAALGLTLVPDGWIWLLGLVPLGLGIKGLVSAIKSRGGDEAPPSVTARGALAVAGVTIANGADNIAVYTPMFRTIGLTGSLVTAGVFAVLVAVWCGAGAYLGTHPKVVRVAGRFGHWIVPVVFLLIGAWIILESR